jgi:hypothetical protein
MYSTLLYGTRTRTSHSYVTIIRRWVLVTLLFLELNTTFVARSSLTLKLFDIMRGVLHRAVTSATFPTTQLATCLYRHKLPPPFAFLGDEEKFVFYSQTSGISKSVSSRMPPIRSNCVRGIGRIWKVSKLAARTRDPTPSPELFCIHISKNGTHPYQVCRVALCIPCD